MFLKICNVIWLLLYENNLKKKSEIENNFSRTNKIYFRKFFKIKGKYELIWPYFLKLAFKNYFLFFNLKTIFKNKF